MNVRPASSICFRFASDIIPASATTVTSGSPCAAMNAFSTGKIVVVSAVLPSNAWTCSGNPRTSVNNPTVIWGSSRRSLENPGSRNPSPSSVSKYNVVTSYEHQGRRSETDMISARPGQLLPPLRRWHRPAAAV